jgi:triphosphoribosyl-dephospho-CoA synthase
MRAVAPAFIAAPIGKNSGDGGPLICTKELSTANPLPGRAHTAGTAAFVAEAASRALLTELLLTPKPGLVDQRNSGAHRDMNIGTFLRSAKVLSRWFPRFVEIGHARAHIPAHSFLSLFRHSGLQCEAEMFEATRGINTHKGAIFLLGLLCAAAGRLSAKSIALSQDLLCSEVAQICLGLVERELIRAETADTPGERVFRSYRLTGARGEAAGGYKLVRTVALPKYRRLRLHGIAEDTALLQVLLHLLAVNGDTNLVSRGGLTALDYVRGYARKILDEGGVLVPDGVRKMAVFDDALIAHHLSPGGSADLLAVTCVLALVPEGPCRNAGNITIDNINATEVENDSSV